MTDAQLKKLAKENNIEPTYELLAFARLVLINAKIQDLKLVAINTRLAVEKEREACAKLCEEPGWNAANWCAKQIRARGDVHAIDISQERVDETAKNRHEPIAWLSKCYNDDNEFLGYTLWDRDVGEGCFPVYTAPKEKNT